MKEFLTIGEVAKLKKITVKALRYYEKIGIFAPAYINEETGYRYYRMDQMIVLDFILTCLDIGIPLKRFPSYLEKDGTLDINRILQDGKKSANLEIERIYRTMDKLKNMSFHLEESEQILGADSCYIQEFPQRIFLIEPLKDLYPTQKQYTSAITSLFFRIEEARYTSLYKQGLLYLTHNGNIRAFAFSEIKEPTDREGTIVIPAGNFECNCLFFKDTWLEGIPTYIEKNNNDRLMLLQERYVRHLSKSPFWEICITNNYSFTLL